MYVCIIYIIAICCANFFPKTTTYCSSTTVWRIRSMIYAGISMQNVKYPKSSQHILSHYHNKISIWIWIWWIIGKLPEWNITPMIMSESQWPNFKPLHKKPLSFLIHESRDLSTKGLAMLASGTKNSANIAGIHFMLLKYWFVIIHGDTCISMIQMIIHVKLEQYIHRMIL